MPAHTYEQLLRALKKGDVAPVYYLYGAEDLLKDDSARAIVDRVLDPSLRDFNFDLRSAQGLDPESVYALCNTLPMLAERRVVVLRDVEAWQKKAKGRAELLRYLAKPAAETVLVMVQGSGAEDADADFAKHAFSVALEPLPPDRALRWSQHQATLLGFVLPDDAAEHLVACVGADLGALRAELAKLAALPEGTAISRDLVGDLVGVRHGETMYDWRDAVLDDEPGRAAQLLGPVLDQTGMTGVKLVTLIGTTLIGVGLARGHYERRLRGRSLEEAVFKTLLKVRPFGLGDWKGEAKRWSEWAERWPARRVGIALRAALDADRQLKSTSISDDRGVLLDLIMKATIPWREAA
jgi:DNA polymerase-3 subunit delta